jgi:hypothetical protein
MKLAQFRCPTTGEVVHHYVADDPKPMDQHRYDMIQCPACSKPHMINRLTGKTMGQKD